MRAINHAVTGAIIGVAVTQPWAALPLAFVSHYVLDAVPHWDPEETDQDKKMRERSFLWILGIDVLACIGLFVYLISIGAVLPAFCAFVATSPDFMWMPMFIRATRGQSSQLPRYALARLHVWVQWLTGPRGLYIEMLYLLASSVVLLLALSK